MPFAAHAGVPAQTNGRRVSDGFGGRLGALTVTTSRAASMRGLLCQTDASVESMSKQIFVSWVKQDSFRGQVRRGRRIAAPALVSTSALEDSGFARWIDG